MTTVEKRRLDKVESELQLLRSAVIGMVKEDSEGAYNPKFVHEMLSAAKEAPTERFKDKGDFLAQVAAADDENV